MADNFERHRSTRWVKADVPSYGDEWGNEYDEYEQDPEQMLEDVEGTSPSSPIAPLHSVAKTGSPLANENVPEPIVSNSTLILSVDKTDFSSKLRDDDVSSDEDSDSEAAANSKRDIEGSSGPRLPAQSSQSKKPSAFSQKSLKDESFNKKMDDSTDFMPPTPTYQTRHQFPPASPETDVSDRSYLSDTDSIQREPDRLNVRAPSNRLAPFSSFSSRVADQASPTNLDTISAGRSSGDLSSTSMSTGERSFIEPVQTYTSQLPPDNLVLSVDALNMDTSDDSSFEEHRSTSNMGPGYHDPPSEASVPEIQNYSDRDDEEDDWGYNSEHSSNFEGQTESLSKSESQPWNSASEQVPPHRVKTDALDSLINDLSKMDGDTSLFDESGARSLDQPQTNSGNSDYHTTRDGKGLLPTLDSIHDMKLPDFENHLFADQDTGDYQPQVSPSTETGHKNFISRVRQDSIRKPPTVLINENSSQFHEPKKTSNTEIALSIPTPQSQDSTPDHHSRKSSHDSSHSKNEEIAAFAKITDLPPPPVAKDMSDVNRRDSTMSTNTFNMGAWKPNTSMYRDQFVNDNDTESQMNVSMYNKDDAAYKKFTRMRPVSNYAPSISNSSCISVPDTVDTALQQIDEDQSDEEYPDAISVAKSYHPSPSLGSSDPSLGSSVLHDHAYETPKFREEDTTPIQSTDDLAPITEEAESYSIHSDSVSTKEPRLGSGSEVSKLKSKYPVSNWKSIMATSQPIDRIELLKKARQDEYEYDTGLSQWLRDSLKSTDSHHIQIGQLATQAYKNAQHSDIRRHTSIRSKVSLVRDKMETGNLGMQATSLGRKFFNKGKKLIKPGSD